VTSAGLSAGAPYFPPRALAIWVLRARPRHNAARGLELTLRPEAEIKATKKRPGGKTSAGPPGVPKSLRLGFRALRNGVKLGAHEVVFSRTGNRLHIEITADYVVRLGLLTLYRYRLRASEVWTGNRLQTATVETDKNGTPEFASVERAGSGFVVEGSGVRPYRAPLSWHLATLWNPDQLKGPLISPLDGSPLRLTWRHADDRRSSTRRERRGRRTITR